MFLNLRSGSLRRQSDKIKGCAIGLRLTFCHHRYIRESTGQTLMGGGPHIRSHALIIRKRIPKFESSENIY